MGAVQVAHTGMGVKLLKATLASSRQLLCGHVGKRRISFPSDCELEFCDLPSRPVTGHAGANIGTCG